MKLFLLEIPKISQLYQSVRHFKGGAIPSGAGDANYSEPLLDRIFIHFCKLMEIYQQD